jgi:DNA invertase Pin-like site-specific DNA recombinase
MLRPRTPRDQIARASSSKATATRRLAGSSTASSVPDALDILGQLADRGVRFALGSSIYDWHDPFARMFLQILAVVAEFEANLTRQRTREGMAIAKSKGRLRGKQPSLSAAKQQALVRMKASGEYTVVELAELFNVSRPTIYRALDRHQARHDASNPGTGAAAAAAAALPADRRPLPDVAKYDELLRR